MKYSYFIFLLLLLTSCEKTIQLDVEEQPPKLVVDASIETGGLPLVVLSRSLNYFSTISAEELSASFERNATVTLSDGSRTIALKEFSITDSSGFTFYFYTPDISDPFNVITGKENTTYQLTITTGDGEQYTAGTSIPQLTKTCDSLWWEPAPEQVEDTTKCVMYGKFTDPPGLGNYIRYFTRVNSEPFLPGLTSVYDDQVVDGTTYDFPFDMGWDKNSIEQPNEDNYGFANRGDTVTLKFCNIDKATYNFWNTWEFAWQSYGNPFSSPVIVTGNVSNNALGAFCGYAVQYTTIVIPK